MGSEGNPEINVIPPEEPGFQLTKEFLDMALDREVEKFKTDVGTNPGDNYMSIMHAIEVTFKGEKEPNHYLIKCYPNNQGRRDFLDQTDVFSKELFMYQEFLPQLKTLAAECGAENIVDLSVAPVHAGNIVGKPSKFTTKPWSDESFILMTDLRKTFGFTMADRIKGLDMDHIKLVLEEIAKVHALTWAYKQKNELALLSNKYPQFQDEMYNNDDMMKDFLQLMNQLSDSCLKMAEDKLGESHPACKSFKDFLAGDIMDRMKIFVQKNGIDEINLESYLRIKPDEDKDYNPEPWLVGTHGDCWTNNFLFLYNDQVPKKPVTVTLVDWQVNREACPTIDLAYFLYCSVRSSLRIPNLDKILRIYHDAFVRYCDALQVKLLPGFTFETLKRRFRRSQHFGLMVSLPLLSIVLKPKEEAVDMDSVESNEMAEVFGSVMVGNDKNELLKHEISQTVLNLYETGVI
ncbi:hypothetical protein Ocin01_07130 [Orchesella cincta]|uniref:CHK kinase-like domain-containing protein n=1 Tax=Orchesella cincta TaxID=48709 RepID=A0A1D2N2Q2_ORCCI|nr:hypothetical protein Ocin01_07130 [Orchesella cincta]